MGMGGSAYAALFFLCLSCGAAQAQSFFANQITDPATGVERGSTLRIRAFDEPIGFVTIASIGADAIGPYIGSVGYSLPGLAAAGDQLDAVAVIGGPSAAGGLELVAGGLGYRLALGDGAPTLYAVADFGSFELGTKALRPLDIRGAIANAWVGARQTWPLGKAGTLTGSMEFGARSERAELLGTEVVHEELRLVRLSAIHSQGLPYGFQSRIALALTKGLDSLGASPVVNPRPSALGVTSDFLRLSASVEASVPLHDRFLMNAGIIGQWSDDSLPVSQRCGYGTNNYARGFDQGYVNGDSCLGGRLELAYDLHRPPPADRRTQLFLGIDAGYVWDNANAFLPAISDRWSSASAGMRTWQGALLAEIALTRILTLPEGAVPQDQMRFWFQIGIQF